MPESDPAGRKQMRKKLGIVFGGAPRNVILTQNRSLRRSAECNSEMFLGSDFPRSPITTCFCDEIFSGLRSRHVFAMKFSAESDSEMFLHPDFQRSRITTRFCDEIFSGTRLRHVFAMKFSAGSNSEMFLNPDFRRNTILTCFWVGFSGS